MSAGTRARRDRLTAGARDGPRSSLWYWSRHAGFLRTSLNYVLMALARVMPSFPVKNWLYRRMGARVHRHAAVGLEVTLDIFFPELIEIEADAVVGYNSTVLCHEYLYDEWRKGPVRIARRASIGANTTILPGVTIGEGAIVSGMSLVNQDIPAGEFWGGVPVRPLKRTPGAVSKASVSRPDDGPAD